MYKKRVLPIVLLAGLIVLSSCGYSKSTADLTTQTVGRTPAAVGVPLSVFAAGSLIIPFDHLEKAFESRYPNIDVQAEYHGSIQVMRHVTDLHEAVDVVATADASLIPMLMYTTQNPQTGKPYADWYIKFASNHLAIAYQPQSMYASEINPDNWYEILSRPDVKVGIADPRFDASGYRALMVFALANNAYHQPDIFKKMFTGKFAYLITIFQDEDLSTITVPEIVDPKSGSNIVIRGASIQLIALLESGDLDYAFEYESVIRQHNLAMVHLPDVLNLGEVDIDYSKVQVNLDFRRFASVQPVFRGERIGYGITIPSNAPHAQEAALFIAFLLGPEGRAVMEADYHPLFNPALGIDCANIPVELQLLCTAEIP